MHDADTAIRGVCLNPTIPTVGRLGWTLYPPGNPEQWDGLLPWFQRVIGKYPPLVERHSLLRRWARAW
ncbi:MAG: hypothetical protein WAV07_07920 [Candidatus Contendobacter sp.]